MTYQDRISNRLKFRFKLILIPVSLYLALEGLGCAPSTLTGINVGSSASATATPTSTTTSTTATTIPGGVKAVKIFFKQGTSGSFDSVPYGGTSVTPGSGLKATRVFNPNGTSLATAGPSGSNWPTWLSNFEIGVSGSNNTGSQYDYCANFASNQESSQNNCNLGGTSTTANCGAPSGQFRVSETDCVKGTPTTPPGTGSASDGVYIRAVFNRDTTILGNTENVLVVLEYATSFLNAAPTNPATRCFSASTGTLSPETCSDFVWRAFLKFSATDPATPSQSFFMVVPPSTVSVLPAGSTAASSSGTNIVTRQIVLPLAADPRLTVLQLSRTGSAFPDTAKLLSTCNLAGTLPANTPLCAGIVFYSMSLYRI